LKVKRWKNIYHANYEHKEARMTILPSDKIDFKEKSITGDKHFIMMKNTNSPRSHDNDKYV